MKVATLLISAQENPGAPAPTFPSSSRGQRIRVHLPDRSTYRNLRTIYAAVAWAQHYYDPTTGTQQWPASAWGRYLKAGTTPRTLAYWVAHGWAIPDALRFLHRFADYPIAQRWRETGDVSARAARFAGRGEVPEDEQPWLDVGFAPDEADPWRTYDKMNRGYRTPAGAWHWHSQGVTPGSVTDFEGLPPTEQAALERANAHARHRTRFGWVFPDPTLNKALEWVRAGVRPSEILAWHRVLGPDETALKVALDWAGYVPATKYPPISAWNHTHPETPVTPHLVASLRRLGMPFGADVAGQVAAANLTTEEILRPLSMLIHAKRWLGIEARTVLAEAAHNQYLEHHGHPYQERPPLELPDRVDKNGAAHPQTRMKDNLEVTLDHIEAGNWAWVVRDMRLIYTKCTLWGPYVDWLATRPVPPQLPNRVVI